MSIRGRTFTSDRRCFDYCGDDVCNCDAHPDAGSFQPDAAPADAPLEGVISVETRDEPPLSPPSPTSPQTTEEPRQ